MNFIKLKRKTKFIYNGICNTVLAKLICKKQFNISDTLIVMGSTRSGTTWLSEIVASIPNSIICFEPISPTHVPEAKCAGFSYDTYAVPDTSWPEGYQVMQKILSGQLLTPWTLSQSRVSTFCAANILVVKFVRANMLVGWLTGNFPVRSPALIIRHPCATVASQLQKGWCPSLESLLNNSFFADKTNLVNQLSGLQTPEEILALRWCMRYFVPLSLSDRPFVLVSYERLVSDGQKELERLFGHWRIDLPKQAIDRLHRASNTVAVGSAIISGADRLTAWQTRLTTAQVARIFNIVSLFGIHCYSDDAEPDYDMLYKQVPKLQY